MKILFPVVFLLMSYSLLAQNINFTARAPKVVNVGESFRITYAVNAKGKDFKAPSFNSFYAQGPSVSSQSSIEIINGRMKQSYSYSYTFFAQASKAGQFTIPKAKINVGGKIYQSNSLKIEVVGKGAGNNERTKSSSQPNVDAQNKKIFVRTFVSKKNVYMGESLLATIKFYTRLDIADVNDVKMPSFTGFWMQDVFSASQISFEKENLGGTIYNVAVIKKVLLFPQKIGTLSIDPFKMDVVLGRRTFFGIQPSGSKILKTKTLKIKVRDFPANTPVNFIGAVGQFKIKANVDNQNVKTNDAIQFTIRFQGVGNIKLIEAPKISFPQDFEVYDPKVATNIKNTDKGQIGSRAFQYLVIPRHAGSFKIPSLEFSYFDPSVSSFKTLKTNEIPIVVEKGSGAASSAVIDNRSVIKSNVEMLHSDILFIKQNKPEFNEKDSYFIGTKNYYLVLFVPFVVLILLFILLRKRAKELSDLAKMRNKKAGKISRQRLKEAKKQLRNNNSEAFYDSIHLALLGYLSDKLNIPLADLSAEVLKLALESKHVLPEIITDYLDLLSKSEYAKYAPGDVGEDLENVYAKAAKLIDRIERKL